LTTNRLSSESRFVAVGGIEHEHEHEHENEHENEHEHEHEHENENELLMQTKAGLCLIDQRLSARPAITA